MAVKAAALKARPTWAEIITCPMGLVRVGMSIGFTTRPISAVAISGPIIQGSGRSSRLNRYPATDATAYQRASSLMLRRVIVSQILLRFRPGQPAGRAGLAPSAWLLLVALFALSPAPRPAAASALQLGSSPCR